MTPLVVDSELQLQQLTVAHASELFALTDRNRFYLREWLPWLDNVRSTTDTDAFIDMTTALYRDSRAFTAGIFWRNRMVGVMGHNRIEWDNRITHLGYWLSADCQGHGIVTRCCRAVIEHAFDSYDLNRVEIHTAVGNHRSEAIPRRLGFTREGIRRQGEWLYDRFVDLQVHALLRSTWRLRQTIHKRELA